MRRTAEAAINLAARAQLVAVVFAATRRRTQRIAEAAAELVQAASLVKPVLVYVLRTSMTAQAPASISQMTPATVGRVETHARAERYAKAVSVSARRARLIVPEPVPM
jgi:phosphoribosylanthranilate isomerase